MSSLPFQHQRGASEPQCRCSFETRFVIVIAVIVVAAAVDYVLHTLWLPSFVGQLAVRQLRPDDAVAQTMRGITHWGNWTHAALAVVVGVATFMLLYPFKERLVSAVRKQESRNEDT